MGVDHNETDFHLVGKLAGMDQLANYIYPLLQQWVPNWERGGEPGYVAMRPAVGLYRTAMPQFHQAGANLTDMLSEDWLARTDPGVQALAEAGAAASAADAGRVGEDLMRRYGSPGGSPSSAMARTVDRASRKATRAQERRALEREYAAYQQKLGMMPELLQQSRQEPYQAAKMIGDRSREILEMFLHYLGLAKPTVATDAEGWNARLPGGSQQNMGAWLGKVFS
jgi:hypothetical protein